METSKIIPMARYQLMLYKGCLAFDKKKIRKSLRLVGQFQSVTAPFHDFKKNISVMMDKTTTGSLFSLM